MSDEQKDETLAVFVVDKGKQARHLFEEIEKIEAIDGNV